jgi:hypothetical protein
VNGRWPPAKVATSNDEDPAMGPLASILPDGPVAGVDPVALSRAFQLMLLARSGERDQYMDRILAAELRGWDRRQADVDAAYERGWLAAIAELKRAQAETVALIRDRAPVWAMHHKALFRDGAS